MDPCQVRLQTFIDLLGEPYSGNVEEKTITPARVGVAGAVSVGIETTSRGAPKSLTIVVWDCFGVITILEASALELLSASHTARIAVYNRSVQYLQPLVSCAAMQRRDDGDWVVFQNLLQA